VTRDFLVHLLDTPARRPFLWHTRSLTFDARILSGLVLFFRDPFVLARLRDCEFPLSTRGLLLLAFYLMAPPG